MNLRNSGSKLQHFQLWAHNILADSFQVCSGDVFICSTLFVPCVQLWSTVQQMSASAHCLNHSHAFILFFFFLQSSSVFNPSVSYFWSNSEAWAQNSGLRGKSPIKPDWCDTSKQVNNAMGQRHECLQVVLIPVFRDHESNMGRYRFTIELGPWVKCWCVTHDWRH